ncbi:MAG: BamA/TamA family outer membrane protein, partial [Bacteroidia bacterium]|nr:BamA/TamA family outer membrane protein [Bacteroidia bacterium]
MNFFISSIFKIIALLFCLLSLPITAQTTDSSSQYTIRSIKLIGNKKTKDKIILRELVKKEGDTLTLKYHPHIKLRSEYNIFNTQLFIFDSILSTVNDSSRTIDYTIKLKERWYIWPIPFVDYLDRNINSWWQTKEVSRLAVGMQINFENFSGVKDWLLIQFRVGYANQFVINYRLPYLNKKQTLGTYVQYSYNEFNKISYATLNNKQQFVTDENEHVRTDNSIRAGVFYRPRLFQYHSFDVGAYQINVSPFLRSFNTDYLLNQSNKLSFINLTYRASFDNRDNKIYPLKGTVLDLIISKDGLNLSEQSPLNYAATLFTYKQFLPIHKKLNFATLWRTRLVNIDKKVPYIYNQALGYSNFIRGYE